MDDLLTILLVVGWMALGIYQNSRKQKKIKEAKRQAAEREAYAPPPPRPVAQKAPPVEKPAPQPMPETWEELPPEPNLEDVLGELLGMPTKPKPVVKTPVSKPAQPLKAEPYSPLAYTPLIDQINKPQYESIEFREEHKTPGYQIEDSAHERWNYPGFDGFDLRQAVIYSAILNRPYS
jgi:hypothetical protein